MIDPTTQSGLQPKAPESTPVLSAVSHSGPRPAEAEPPPSRGQLEAVAAELSQHLQNLRRTLSFSVEETTGRTVISVYNADTDELIRQIPSEEALRVLTRLQSGDATLLLEERA